MTRRFVLAVLELVGVAVVAVGLAGVVMQLDDLIRLLTP